MLLQSYPELRTRDLELVAAALRFSVLGSRGGSRSHDEFVINAANFKEAGLAFISYESPNSFAINPCSDVLMGYQLRGVSEVVVDGDVFENGVIQPGCLIPSERSWSVETPSGYQVLMLRVAADTLRRKLSALLGMDRVRLDLRQPASAGLTRALLRESVLNFAKELDGVDQQFLPVLLANSIDQICLAILTSLNEQVLEADRSPAAPSAVQLGRVEDYIFANYAKPLTVETLALVSSVSGRSVFRHFVSRYGCTPHDYLETVRLDMARARLPAYRDRGSVASVALRCGFPSLNNFAQAYRKRFGELPSTMFGEISVIPMQRPKVGTGLRR